ncbi:unnamed protein product [Danaus chrysippus]|uniref:(African queen) hypothetical protein n=1 Tax=Danaus chrysippus TaxID=151541 RepID=A0A8J2MAV4_9NEOP|nr:unnamed protein product [Danaus chrysippus]
MLRHPILDMFGVKGVLADRAACVYMCVCFLAAGVGAAVVGRPPPPPGLVRPSQPTEHCLAISAIICGVLNVINTTTTPKTKPKPHRCGRRSNISTR